MNYFFVLSYSFLSFKNFYWFETHWFCVFDGLAEEMILIGMATRRSSLTLTSECIKAATTTDSRIGFQISIPERGVAFQHLLLNSPTHTTGGLFCEGEWTICNTTWLRDNMAYHSFEPLYCSRGLSFTVTSIVL